MSASFARKVVLFMSVSVDGFVARPGGDLSWLAGQVDDEVMAWTIDVVRQTDTQLLGRVAYEEQAQYWPTSTDELAPLINDAEKIVFSSTLDQVEWRNARLAKGDPAEEIAQLKDQPGADILVPGGARFAQSLSGLGLIDEYRLRVHPIALGRGLPLFADESALALVSAKTFSSGVVGLTYRPA